MSHLPLAELATGLLIAIALGVGLNLIIWFVPPSVQRNFADRISPHVKVLGGIPHRNSPTTGFGIGEQLLRPIMEPLTDITKKIGIGGEDVEFKLSQAGDSRTLAQFRNQQIYAAVLIGMLAVLLNVFLAAAGAVNLPFALASTLLGLLAGFLLPVQLLSAKIVRRERAILSEFPAVAELIALAVSAGDTALAALSRAHKNATGVLPEEFGRLMSSVNAGTPLRDALLDMSERVRVNPVQRFVEGIVVAIERGTPLADVVRAQAQDARDVAKRELMEMAGKKEISMLVPVVFGLLPLTIVFAIYPGLTLLTLDL